MSSLIDSSHIYNNSGAQKDSKAFSWVAWIFYPDSRDTYCAILLKNHFTGKHIHLHLLYVLNALTSLINGKLIHTCYKLNVNPPV